MVLNIHVHSMSHAKVAAFLLDSSVSFKCIKVFFSSNNSSYGLNTEPQPHEEPSVKNLHTAMHQQC